MSPVFSPTSLAGLLLGLMAAAVVVPLSPGDPRADDQPRPARHRRTASVAATPEGAPFELLLYGATDDGDRLAADAGPDWVFRVPAGQRLVITDIDAASRGLGLLRKRGHHLEQVAFAAEQGSVGVGQCARSLVSGVVFEAGDELLLAPAGSAVEWAALRGRRFTSAGD